MIKVGVNGYGVIGKRVAYAVSKQDDMQLVGIAKQGPDYKAKLAIKRGFSVYTSGDPKDFDDSGVKLSGTLQDLLGKVDVMVDATPEGVGAENKAMYEKAGIKAVWEGGEEHSISNLSFNAYANYNSAIGARYVRVVSCNTTGLTRTLFPLQKEFGITSVNAVLVRRGADPSETKKGPIDALEVDKHIPSHHGPDVKTVMPDLNITTVAIKASTTLMHLHAVTVELKREATNEEVLSVFGGYRRIALVDMDDGVKSTAQVMDIARSLGRGEGDMYEIAVWRGLKVEGKRLQYFQAVHQESDVVPENVDAIRAMCNGEKDAQRSIDKTDKSLDIGIFK
jgi:glyceraldehyde-3-phosphate dehydrogenase (NAD(P))